MNDVRFYGLTLLGLALFPLAIHPIGGYPGLATQILIVSIATIGFNLLLGYAGLLSYGQAAFYGLGSYVALLTISRFFPTHPNFWLALALAVGFVTLMAFLIGLLVVRLYGIYFALLTLAFAQMFFFVVFKWHDLTQGDDGLQAITAPPLALGFASIDLTKTLPPLDLGPFGNLADVHYWYVFAAIVMFAVLAFTRTLVRSQFGEVLGAIRDNEERSTFVGFDPRRYKLAAFVIAGALTGLSGALRGLYESSTAPDSLTVETSGNFVIFAVVGGVKTLFGPLLGTGLIMYLQNVISAKTDAWRLFEGILFVAVIVFLPGGILGSFKRNRARAVLVDSVRSAPAEGATH
ncbi:MAG: branched-chain amino acid ABC transporter permease [Candidatus Eremiobacteraeota bacterium]|nr:branched-chain amino acid ABC transporter permease [Candidatus Eremiobacteraeota bacterium]